MVGPWRGSRERIRDIWGIGHRQPASLAAGGKSRRVVSGGASGRSTVAHRDTERPVARTQFLRACCSCHTSHHDTSQGRGDRPPLSLSWRDSSINLGLGALQGGAHAFADRFAFPDRDAAWRNAGGIGAIADEQSMVRKTLWELDGGTNVLLFLELSTVQDNTGQQ